MNILFITVGMSALENNHVGRASDDRDNASLKAEVRRYFNDPYQHEKHWMRLREDLIQAHLRYWNAGAAYQNDTLHFEYTSAELTSTIFLLRGLESQSLPERLVLLCSDTNKGKFAAHINAEALHHLHPEIPVEAKHVPHLDVEFKDTRVELRRIFDEVYRLRKGDQVTINITGGYKGTIPFLTWFAIKNDWKLYFQHLEHDSAVRLDFKDGETTTVKEWQPWKV